MAEGAFDLAALLRGLAIGIAAGGIVALITNAKTTRTIATVTGVVTAVFLTIVLPLVWSSLVAVPDLAGLSGAEAEELLAKRHLLTEVTTQRSDSAQAGRVLPGSQNPLPGIKVRRGSVVRFVVAGGPPEPSPVPIGGGLPRVELYGPTSGESVACTVSGDGFCRLQVQGGSDGVSGEAYVLLLWVQPVSPPSETPGWYLQHGPACGVSGPSADGSWRAMAQLGSPQWPPHEGDTINVAVTVTPAESGRQLLAQRGVVTRLEPVGVASDVAMGVTVSLR